MKPASVDPWGGGGGDHIYIYIHVYVYICIIYIYIEHIRNHIVLASSMFRTKV